LSELENTGRQPPDPRLCAVLVSEKAANGPSTYAKDHPAAFHEISMLLTGKALDETTEECRLLAHSVLAIVFYPAIR
jgi:hypothetical protein